jgi:hypothetical protein
MIWEIESERLLDGAVLLDRSPTDRESAIRAAYRLIDQGHDVRYVAAPDGTREGAAAIAEAYLGRFRVGAPTLGHEPGTQLFASIRSDEDQESDPVANIGRLPRHRSNRKS